MRRTDGATTHGRKSIAFSNSILPSLWRGPFVARTPIRGIANHHDPTQAVSSPTQYGALPLSLTCRQSLAWIRLLRRVL
jgi:hypothetical protein